MAPFVHTFYSYLKSKLKLYLAYNFENKQIINQHMDSLEIHQLFTLLQDIQTTIGIIQQVILFLSVNSNTQKRTTQIRPSSICFKINFQHFHSTLHHIVFRSFIWNLKTFLTRSCSSCNHY